MVTIYICTFNDAHIIEFCIKHYKRNFPQATIILFDNFSTDDTVLIAKKMGALVWEYYTGSQMDDQAIINVKNQVWKRSAPYTGMVADWVIMVDADELLQVNENILQFSYQYTIINAQAVDMVGMHDTDTHPEQLIYGVHYSHIPRKMLAFRRDRIIDINYGFGSHTAMPIGRVYIDEAQEYHHYKYISPSHVIGRNNMIGPRLSAMNKRKALSFHYNHSPSKVKGHFKKLRKQAKLISGKL